MTRSGGIRIIPVVNDLVRPWHILKSNPVSESSVLLVKL